MLVEEENGTAKYIASSHRPEKSRKRRKEKIENRTATARRSFERNTHHFDRVPRAVADLPVSQAFLVLNPSPCRSPDYRKVTNHD
jgi:hypothetical protein